MKIILAQTDTTVGFLSQNASLLESAKERPQNKPFLKVYASLRRLRNEIRVPLIHRRNIRYAKATTFIVKNQAFRYVGHHEHAHLVSRHQWLYSTSANQSGERFDYDFCFDRADWIVEDYRGFKECASSAILKLGRTRSKKLR